MTPEEKDEINKEKSDIKKAADQVQKDASTAKDKVEENEQIVEAKKVDKDSAIEIKKGEKEIEAKKEIKAKVAAEQQPSEADLNMPGHSKGEAWTINMPEHVLEGYAQKGRSDIKDHQLTQEKDEEENDSESEDEEEEEDDQ